VRSTIAKIHAIEAEHGITRDSLELIAAQLEALAARQELFPADEFPPAVPGDPSLSTHYVLHQDPNQGYSLRLNSFNPGKTSFPHNHTTWAVLVALEGEELNRVYERTDDGSDPAYGQVRQVRELVVRPGGDHATYLGDDIHSIHVTGRSSTRHLHLYGRSLDSLTSRIGFDPATGRIVNYNQRFYDASRDVKV
jgi:predicted metal-dependent enzyme (double-stranded beta helix superfamily)